MYLLYRTKKCPFNDAAWCECLSSMGQKKNIYKNVHSTILHVSYLWVKKPVLMQCSLSK